MVMVVVHFLLLLLFRFSFFCFLFFSFSFEEINSKGRICGSMTVRKWYIYEQRERERENRRGDFLDGWIMVTGEILRVGRKGSSLLWGRCTQGHGSDLGQDLSHLDSVF